MLAEIALVTGAGSGIGAAVAENLARRGASVALVDVDGAGLEQTMGRVVHAGGTAVPIVADVSDEPAILDAARRTTRELGTLSTVVACAGVATLGDVSEVDLDSWNRTMAVNVTGVYLTARCTIDSLIERRGTFTAIVSDAGVWAAPGYVAYTASKHAVVGLIKSMALDHGPHGVRCNAVCPGFVETAMAERIFADAPPRERDHYLSTVPLGRFAQPQDVAAAVAHLSSPEASHTNGLLYRVDGGATAGYFRS